MWDTATVIHRETIDMAEHIDNLGRRHWLKTVSNTV